MGCNLLDDIDELVFDEELADAVTATPVPVLEPNPLPASPFCLPADRVSTTLQDLAGLMARSESTRSVYPTGIAQLDGWIDGGITPGNLIALCASPNFGKSAVLQSITRGMLDLNKDVIVMAYTIDDNVYNYLARYLAGEGHLPIWAVTQAQGRRRCDETNGTNYEACFQRGKQRFTEYTAQRLMLLGLQDIMLPGKGAPSPLDVIEEQIKTTYRAVRTSAGQRPQLVLTIDSPRNIKIKEGNLASNPTALTEYIGSTVKSWLDLTLEIDGQKERIEPIIFTTEHIKKLPKEQKRPGMDDIKDSVTLQYHADMVLMLWNDPCYRARILKTQEPSQMIFARRDIAYKSKSGRTIMDPVVELTLSKNKMGRMEYGGASATDLFRFYQDQSRVEEITDRIEFDTYACYLEG